MPGAPLNFHHLRYFWAVAKDGNLTRTAARLRVSQSALSTQIRQLEDALGEQLFLREGRALKLSEAGHIAFAHAADIFAAGDELVATLKEGRGGAQPLRLGAVATLSRNFQESFIRPLLRDGRARLRLESGRLGDLLGNLDEHELDLVLSNRAVQREPGRAWRCRRIARQGVSVIGRPGRKRFRFAADLAARPMILPGPDSAMRSEFDALCEQLGVKVSVLAEVDDMATMRLLVRDTDALAVMPSIVVRDELRSGALSELAVVPGVFESFYAITLARRFQHPLVRRLLGRDELELLAMDSAAERG
jgi:LysR family transcriptional regulator, transcriptional activator of nhaA